MESKGQGQVGRLSREHGVGTVLGIPNIEAGLPAVSDHPHLDVRFSIWEARRQRVQMRERDCWEGWCLGAGIAGICQPPRYYRLVMW